LGTKKDNNSKNLLVAKYASNGDSVLTSAISLLQKQWQTMYLAGCKD